ncbi:geranylgeranylglyceryl/heptaprenylglyceryl phosphate synthase [Negadavirga shengliensis]|uniref:Geranylgeranylglyceryl phosphate synthase n=1 Tax=Negadavirga shengliensis TaxID=1389218 RepID=A0ABV9T198_9BACT
MAKKDNIILEGFFALRRTGRKATALLIDPGKIFSLRPILDKALEADVDYLFVGGSLTDPADVSKTVQYIRRHVMHIPIIIFPGNATHFSPEADAVLFISLISGRNADLLIGQHVMAAPALAKSGLEILPTGYILVDGGSMTSVQYVSQTLPLPNDKPDLASATALAGKYLGLKLFYLDAGSGALNPVSKDLIAAVSRDTASPLIVGGGINCPKKAKDAWDAGADVVVIGNGAEKNPGILTEVVQYAKMSNASLNVN